jgi:hypothetical protein
MRSKNYEGMGGRNMRKPLMLLAVGILATTVTQGDPKASIAQSSKLKASDHQYEVLNPWAEVDPIPVRGITPRLESLSGKKIGLFVNFKRAARPIAASIEQKLKAMDPDCETSQFDSREPNVTETETKNKDRFVAWAKGVDAVIAVVGD